MEAISFLTSYVNYLLALIPVGTGAMVTYYSIKKSLSFDMEEQGHCDIKIKQTIKGAIVGISMVGIITVIKRFYI